jgi:uncharacterized protein involved in exopolysaccharide biosynthesis
MPAIIEGPPGPDAPPEPLWRRLAWFVGIAVTASGATAIVAMALEALLPSH